MINSRNLRSTIIFALVLSALAITMAGCGMRIETYGYAPDSFFREDRQIPAAKDNGRYEK